eukprot:s937_g4.t1
MVYRVALGDDQIYASVNTAYAGYPHGKAKGPNRSVQGSLGCDIRSQKGFITRALWEKEVRCPSCGQFNPSDANFCRHCGRRLAAITPADHFSFSLGSSAAAAPARGRPEMSDLLADLETREAALRAKVQQLTDEKSLREKRLEDTAYMLRQLGCQGLVRGSMALVQRCLASPTDQEHWACHEMLCRMIPKVLADAWIL